MNRALGYFLIAVFSIFFGSQVSEGFLLVPYWKSLSAPAFYKYYSQFGLTIGRFYTILTIIAALIPVSISIYGFYKKSNALTYSLISTVFTFSCIALFYIYFKGINQQFFNASFNPTQLKSELETWEYVHWFRVFLELIALIFLMLSLTVLTKKELNTNIQTI
ncbi:hypothetical protein [Polaribacter gochangensis]|uniref:hypothetical protein n=1 Tax=Polaribacter gochangensis TaxID=3252903 RepID=UPI0039049535